MAGSDPLAQSMVEVIADTSTVKAQMVRELEQAAAISAQEASKVLQTQLDAGFEETITALGKIVDAGFSALGGEAAENLVTAMDSTILGIGETSAITLSDKVREHLAAEMPAIGGQAADALGAGLLPGVTAAGDAAASSFSSGLSSIDAAAREAAALAAEAMGKQEPSFAAAGEREGHAFSEGLSKASDNGAVSAAQTAVGKFGSTMEAGLLTAGKFAGAATVGLTAFGVKSAGDLQQTNIAFTQLTGSAQNAQKEIADLQSFAASTPFEFKDVSKASETLLAVGKAAGITQQNLIPVLSTIGDVGSAFGASGAQINGAINALAQIAGAGKFDMGNLNQISNNLNGFPARAVLAEQAAKAWGVSTQEAMTRISNGALPAQQGIQLLLQGMKEYPGAAGGMQKQSESLLGVLSTFADTARNSLSNAFAPAIPQITKAMNDLVPVMQSALDKLGPVISQTLVAILPVVGQVINAFATIMTPLIPVISTVGNVLDSMLKVLGPLLANLFTALAPLAGPINNLIIALVQFASAALTPLLPLITQFVSALVSSGLDEAIFELLQAVAPLVTALGGAFIKALTAILPVLPPLVNGITALVTAFSPIFAQLVGIVADVFVKLGPILTLIAQVMISALQPVLPVLANAFTEILTAVEPLVPLLAGAFLQVIQALAPVLPDIVNAFLAWINAVTPLIPVMSKLLGWLVSVELAIAKFIDIKILIPIIDLLAKGLTFFYRDVLGPTISFMIDVLHWSKELGEYLAGAFVTAWHDLQAAGRAVVDFFEALPGYMLTALTALGQVFAVAWQGIIAGADVVVRFFERLPGLILNELIALPGQLLDVFVGAIALVLYGIRDSILLVIGAFVNLVQGIIYAVTVLPGKLADLITEALTAAYNAAITAGVAVANWFLQLGKTIISELVALPGQLADVFTTALNATVHALETGGVAVFNFFVQLPGRVVTAVGDLAGTVAGLFSRALGAAKSAVSTGIDDIAGFFRQLPGKLLDAGGSLLSAGEQLMQKIFDGFGHVASIGKNIALGIADAVIDVVNSVIRQVNDFFSVHVPGTDIDIKLGIPTIPRLAAGMIATRPMLAYIGEAGDEAVIPLTNPARAVQLSQQSGLTDLLARSGAFGNQGKGGQVINMTVNTVAQDTAVVAAQVVGQLARKAA